MEEESNFPPELHSLKRGKAGLVDVLHKLDLVASYLSRMQVLERTTQAHAAALAELQRQCHSYVTPTELHIACDQLTRELSESWTKRVAAVEGSWEQRLQLFPMKVQMEAALAEKAGGAVVARLHANVSNLNSQFDALNSSVFEAFKVEVRRSLATKVDSTTIDETLSSLTTSEPWQHLIKRLETAENSLQSAETTGSSTPAQTVKGREDLVKWVTGTQQDVDLLKERTREWRVDVEERCEKLEAEVQKWRHMWEKEGERVRDRGGKTGKRTERAEIVGTEEEETANHVRKSAEKTSKEGSVLLKRLIRLETDMDSLHLTMKYLKTRQRDRINDFSQRLQHLTDHKEAISRDFSYLQARLNNLETLHHTDIQTIEQELERLKGPMTDLLNTQALESDALHGEIKRHQEVLRSFVSDRSVTSACKMTLAPAIKTSPPPFISPRRLDLMDRVQSASPAVKLRKRLRPGTLNRREEGQEDSTSFSSSRPENSILLERRRVLASRGGTPGRRNNVEAVLPVHTPQFLE